MGAEIWIRHIDTLIDTVVESLTHIHELWFYAQEAKQRRHWWLSSQRAFFASLSLKRLSPKMIKKSIHYNFLVYADVDSRKKHIFVVIPSFPTKILFLLESNSVYITLSSKDEQNDILFVYNLLFKTFPEILCYRILF